MHDRADAAPLTPEERFRKVAAILASSVLRLRQRGALPPDETPRKVSQFPEAGLEVPDETVLSGHTG
jgi:hypothetical protein